MFQQLPPRTFASFRIYCPWLPSASYCILEGENQSDLIQFMYA